MAEISYGTVRATLEPFEGLGTVIVFAIAIVMLWETAIVLSVLLATLTGPRRDRGSERPR